MIKEILKSDVGILNKYFLVTLILVLLTIVGYTSYALFSYEEISSTGIRIKYTGKLKQSEGNLANSWKNKTENVKNYLAIYTLGKKDLPETYSYDGTTYTLNTTIDVSEQSNGNVILGEYTSGSNMIAIIGQDGKVMAPVNSSGLFNFGYITNGSSILKELDVSNLDTSQVTNMSAMFEYCISLTSLDVSNLDTSNVTSMEAMFYECNSLMEINFGDNFDTSKVTNMNQMFRACKKLTVLDLSVFKTSSSCDMFAMFFRCSGLTKIIVGCNWTTGSYNEDMFKSAGVSSVTKVC